MILLKSRFILFLEQMKNKIQIVIVLLVAVFGFVWISNAAYSLSWDELKHFNAQKVTISQASDSGLWSYYTQLSKWYNILKANERLGTISSNLRDYAYSLLDSRKNLAKQQSAAVKTAFLGEYEDNISIDAEFPKDKCTGWYNTIDNISFANDFPTALTIAVWYRESNCAYYLPNNGDWPFQIVNKDYWAGEITEEIFKQTIQDYIDFSKNKIEKYNNRAWDEYPEIHISYKSFDYTWVVSYLALYNWGTKTWWVVVPNAPEYVFDWYGDAYSGSKKYGVFPMLLKVLEREVENM